METLTEIHQQEVARRQRAARYEDALSSAAGLAKQIPQLEAKAESYAKQVRLLTKLAKDVTGIDPKIDVSYTTLGSTIQGRAHDLVGVLVQRTLADQKRRQDDALQALTKARADLQKAQQTLAELS